MGEAGTRALAALRVVLTAPVDKREQAAMALVAALHTAKGEHDELFCPPYASAADYFSVLYDMVVDSSPSLRECMCVGRALCCVQRESREYRLAASPRCRDAILALFSMPVTTMTFVNR